MVGVQEVSRLIDMTEAGDYDSYHEWSPSFDLPAKAEVLGTLLASWGATEPEGQRLILQFARKLNRDWRYSAEPITDIMVRYAGLPEVSAMVLDEFLSSGRFCHYLLLSMRAQHVSQERWLSRIKALATERKFTESKRILRSCKVYEGIEALLALLTALREPAGMRPCDTSEDRANTAQWR